MSRPADDQLRRWLAAAVEGDDRALTALVRATQPEVWRLCRYLGSNGEVEDLVQETYLRFLRAMPSYRGDAPVLVWLVSIARYTCADAVRRRGRRRELLAKLPPSDELYDPWGDDVRDYFVGLDGDGGQAFLLTQVLGFPYEDAAAALDCPIGTIRSRVARTRTALLARERIVRSS